MLFWQFAKRDAERSGHSFAVGRVGFEAVGDVPELNLPRRAAMIAQGTDRAARFTWDRAARDTLALYREVATL